MTSMSSRLLLLVMGLTILVGCGSDGSKAEKEPALTPSMTTPPTDASGKATGPPPIAPVPENR